jgi:hypothetical protein
VVEVLFLVCSPRTLHSYCFLSSLELSQVVVIVSRMYGAKASRRISPSSHFASVSWINIGG